MTEQTKPKVALHAFIRDTDLPPDSRGRHVCVCGLVGTPGDAHHTLPDVDQGAHRRRYGDE